MSDKERDSFQAFDSTKVTTLGDDLFKISSKIPFFLFSILMEGLSVVFFTAVFVLWALNPDTWILDELCIFASFSVFFFGLILLTSVLKFFKPFMKISDRIKPIRFKVKMELFPVNKKNLLTEMLQRLDDVFYLKIRDPKRCIDKKVKAGKNSENYGIFHENKQNSVIYIFTILMISVLLVAIFVESIVYSHFDSWINFALLIVFEIIILAIFVLVILRFFYRTEIIMFDKYEKRVTRKDVLDFKEKVEQTLKWYQVPLIIGMVSTKGFDDNAADLVRTVKGKVNSEFTVTLVQYQEKRFNVIWTG